MGKDELLQKMREGYVHLWTYFDVYAARDRYIASHRPYNDEKPEAMIDDEVQLRSVQPLISAGVIEKVKRADGYTFLRLTEAMQ